jgi:predicted glutamine amidotransferase
MCGLVGMAGYLEPFKHKNVMKDMLFLNALRGRDSTGLSCVSRDKFVTTRKMTVPSYEFIEYPVVDKAMKFGDQVWMGHSRYKTTGEVNRQNAHPFEVLDDEGLILLVGAHNGTLNNKWAVEQMAGGGKFDTDSEALFNALVEQDDFKAAINGFEGAWSLTFYDPTANSLHFCRNKERPLCFAWSKDRKVLLWASEPWFIINAARRNNMELAANERGIHCFSTAEDKMYTLKIPQERDKELPEMEVEGGYSGKQRVPFQAGWNRIWGNESDDYWQEKQKAIAEGKKEGTADRKADGTKIITIGEPPEEKGKIRGFEGEHLSIEGFRKIQERGCVWCKDPFDKNGGFAFLENEALVCGNCIHGRHPQGDCLRPDEDYVDPNEDFDDDLPFELGPAAVNSEEYKQLMQQAAAQTVG